MTDSVPGPDVVEALLAECLAKPEGEIAAAIEEACRLHPEHADELRARFELLARTGLAGGSAESPEFPERLGDFRLIERLGGGGMGVVYRAEQESLKRAVALKLVRPELLYFPDARERFRREVDAIAKLQHPGIVAVHAVGEENGVPYFAMELIGGCTLAEVLHGLRDRAPESLSAEDVALVLRDSKQIEAAPHAFEGPWVALCLRLVMQVAEALHHAHERGIVHRDVKPSNIAVSTDGRALLLDFGLTSSASMERFTRTGAQVGTPAYMSPEQLEGERDIDARTDVYSLGVTLYELISLQVPFGDGSSPDTQQRILYGTPFSLRSRNRKVSSDLETVCFKAMDRDRARRYADCQAFAEDLRNVLEHRPVQARPPSSTLRVRRWVRRNPALSAVIVLAVLLIVGLPTVMWIQSAAHSREVEIERDRALEEKVTTEATLDFVLGLFTDVDPSRARGEALTARDLVARGTERIQDELAERPYTRARMLLSLGIVHSGLEDLPAVAPLLEQAVEIFRRDEDPSHRIYLARSLMWLGRASYQENALTDSEAHTRESLALLLELEAPTEDRCFALQTLADLRRACQEFVEAESLYREIVALHEGDPESTFETRHIARRNIGVALMDQARFDEALPYLETGMEADRSANSSDPPMARGLLNLAFAHKHLGHAEESRALYTEGLEMARTLWGDKSLTIAMALINFSGLELATGNLPRAEELLLEARAILDKLVPKDSEVAITCLGNLAGVIFSRQDYARAEPLLLEVLPLQEQFFGETSPHAGYSCFKIAHCLGTRGQSAEADPYFQRAFEILSTHEGQEISALTALTNLASMRRGGSDLEGAAKALEQGFEFARKNGAPDVVKIIGQQLVDIYEKLERTADAERIRALVTRSR